jgi:hypothetical protein
VVFLISAPRVSICALKKDIRPGVVVHSCNPIYSGSAGRKIITKNKKS